MTLRERNMLSIFLVLFGVVVCAVAFQQWFIAPLQEDNRKIGELEDEIAEKDKLIRNVKLEQKRLEKYKALSLPSNPDQAAADYAKYLKPLLRSYGLTVDVQGPPPASLKPAAAPGKKAGHIPLTFIVNAQGEISSIVKALQALRSAPIVHRVKSFTLVPAETSGKDVNGKLKLQMTIEALIVHKAENLNALKSIGSRVPQKETVVRNYHDIEHRNLFVGGQPPPPAVAKKIVPMEEEPAFDVRSYIRLVHTSQSANEAFLRNFVYKLPEQRLRPKTGKFGSGFDIFRIYHEDQTKVLLTGKVLRVDQRDVYFQVVEDIYGIHIGQNLYDAMKRPLSQDALDTLELTSLYDEDFAIQEMEKKSPKKATPTKKTPPKKKL